MVYKWSHGLVNIYDFSHSFSSKKCITLFTIWQTNSYLSWQQRVGSLQYFLLKLKKKKKCDNVKTKNHNFYDISKFYFEKSYFMLKCRNFILYFKKTSPLSWPLVPLPESRVLFLSFVALSTVFYFMVCPLFDLILYMRLVQTKCSNLNNKMSYNKHLFIVFRNEWNICMIKSLI